MSILYTLFGYIMKFCYSISFSNYIIALFFFALIMQIILFPLGIKQQKSSVLMSKIRPKEQAIRNKYRGRNDRATQQKMQLEIQDMYKEEGYSATAGCLPLLIQFPLIIVLFGIVQGPLTYTTDLNNSSVGDKVVVIEATEGTEEALRAYNLTDFYQASYGIIDNQTAAYESRLNEMITEKGLKFDDYKALDTFLKDSANEKKEGFVEGKALVESDEYKGAKSAIDNLAATKKNLMNRSNGYREMALINFMQEGIDKFYADFTVDGKFVLEVKSVEDSMLNEGTLKSDVLEGDFISALAAKNDALVSYAGKVRYDFNDMLAAKGFVVASENGMFANNAYALPNFTFIGDTTTLDTPSFSLNWLLLVPIFVFLSSFFSAEISRKLTVQPVGPDGQPANGGFVMKWGMPLISTYFSFTFPAAIGIYWVFRSIFSVVQQFILKKMYPPVQYSDEELKVATTEVKKAKKRKKVITIEVDEDDTTYDDLAISDERAEKLRRIREKRLRDAAVAEDNGEEESKGKIEKPKLKDDTDRKE